MSRQDKCFDVLTGIVRCSALAIMASLVDLDRVAFFGTLRFTGKCANRIRSLATRAG